MQERELGKSKLSISEVGLGCWQLGGDFGPLSDKVAVEIIETALQQNINFFDTADVYGDGKSEAYLGQVLDKRSDNIVIATKYGRGSDAWPDQYSLSGMRDAIKRSQDRLRRSSIDLLQLHCIPPTVLEQGDVFEWLRQMQQEGLIKHFGASVETMPEALLCVKQEGLSSLQIIFNLLRQLPREQLFSQAHELGVGIIVRLPLASGILSGKFTRQSTFDKTDHRNFNRDGAAFSVGETFSGIPFETAIDLTDKLAQKKPTGMNMAQFAMRWILDHPAVSCIIPGASSSHQVISNAEVSALPYLSDKLHEELYQFYQNEVEQHIRCPL